MGLLSLIPMKWVIILGGVLASLGIVYFSYEHWAKAEQAIGAAPYIAAIRKQNDEAAALLAKLTSEAKVKQQALDTFNATRNENDATNETVISLLADKLHAARVLYDPNATGCSGGSAQGQTAPGAQVGGANSAQSGGVLSAELSGLLTRLTSEADTLNAAYISCRADAYEVRK